MKLGDKPIADITTDDITAIRTHWPLKIKQGSKGDTTAPGRNLKRLRHLFKWTIQASSINVAAERHERHDQLFQLTAKSLLIDFQCSIGKEDS